MAYRFDETDGSIVLDGFEKGIADSPFNGISDIRNANIISVPGEASVNFSTSKISSPSVTSVSVVSADSGAKTITWTGGSGLERGMAISFATTPSISGLSALTPYWLGTVTGTTAPLYTDYASSSLAAIAGTGTGTMSAYNITTPKHFAYDKRSGFYFMVDSRGQVWSNMMTTFNLYWTYTGNLLPSTSTTSGNGLVVFQSSDSNPVNVASYLILFHNGSVDYAVITSTLTWAYQWNIATGSVGAYAVTPTQTLNSTVAQTNSHEAFLHTDGRVYYCDGNYVGSFFQTAIATAFVPGTIATYTPTKQALILPTIDIAQCLAPLGTNILVGGQRNVAYPWDRFSTLPNYPIFLPEDYVSKMVTVNTNTYMFMGNRGRIYVTNGSQVQLYKKVPDHISGTVEPYFTWGGATSARNQLYFSLTATNNTGTAITQYGGVWAIDVDTGALRMTNKLSYDTYAGYATAMIAQPQTGTPAGSGMYFGWIDGAGAFGIDQTSSNPYTGSQTTIDFDLIPIGTYQQPKNFNRIEFKLTKPLVTNESVVLNYRLNFSATYVAIPITSVVGEFSANGPINFANAQWLQIQAVLNSTTSSPSYVRLKEIRIK